MLQNPQNKTPNYKTPKSIKRPTLQIAQRNKAPNYKPSNVTKHPMQQNAK